MRWYEKMSEGMRLMKEACADNENWDRCCYCPFVSICDKLVDVGNAIKEFDKYIPVNWEKKEEEK